MPGLHRFAISPGGACFSTPSGLQDVLYPYGCLRFHQFLAQRLLALAALALDQEDRVVRAFARLKRGVTEQARSALAPLFAEERAHVPVLLRPRLSLAIRGLRDRQI
jgi:hypothetical protein